MKIVIAGAGIGGLTAAMCLARAGFEVEVFEAVSELRPLGVGINIQAGAVRILSGLGLEPALAATGIETRELRYANRHGQTIWADPRGRHAGLPWPQFSIHRGELQMILFHAAQRIVGADRIKFGRRIAGFEEANGKVLARFVDRDGRDAGRSTSDILIGADGIHSAVRAQMHPDQPPIHWGGALMWRGVTRAKPIRTGASFVGLGTHRHRVVFYPISKPDPRTGLALINWIAEITLDNAEGWKQYGWFREAAAEDLLHHFEGWSWDWLDVPALIQGAEAIFENPMIDRDPVPTWQDGPVVLLGDAAHAMYPTGSNGASQAIVDARVLGAAFTQHGPTPAALAAYNAKLCEPISKLILRNRGAGPFGLLNIVDERCGGVFDDIDDVIAPAERTEFMAGYKAAAGFAVQELNAAPPILPRSAGASPAKANLAI